MANQHAHAMASFGTPTGFGDLFQNFGGRYRAMRKASRAQALVRRELESYTDRQLRDLGISRHDIIAVATGRISR